MIEKIVKDVMTEVSGGTAACSAGYTYGIFSDMDQAVEAAAAAEKEYLKRPMSDRKKYVQVIRDVITDKQNLEYISKLAVEETGMSVFAPAFSSMFTKPVIGVVTHIDIADEKEIKDARTYLEMAGADPIFEVCGLTGEGLDQVIKYINKIDLDMY